MREIKFRAWDSYNKEMLMDYVWFEKRENYIAANVQNPTTCRIAEVMQFTGLKDMNGKDIYEGDIVRAKFPKNSRTIIFDVCSDPKNYEIVFVSGAFETSSVRVKQDKFSSLTDRLHPIWWDKYCEVIGNIYEHSYLLDK